MAEQDDKKSLTTNFGIPVASNQHSITAGTSGPVLMQDVHLVEKLAHFNRERIPERVVHAKGAGAHGYFEVSNDLSKYTKAAFLSEVGKKTPLFVRFSTVGGEKGSADSERDPRGFAVKFYTEEGNYDLVGNNTPVFFIRDPLKFPDFIHTQKRHPATNTKDPDMFWDFLSLTPESLHQVTILFSDRGTPRSYRHMNGYGSHTFVWENAQGESFYVKYHFKTDQGIQNFDREAAMHMAGVDPDHATRDLFATIADGNFPSWTLYVQIMPVAEAESYRFDVLDVTKVISQKDYPLIEVGKMVLNKNPENYFAEVEQAAFSPGNIVPGIAPSADKMLQGRLFAYADAHRYRVGTNYAHLPVNAAQKAEVANQQRDGYMSFTDNGGSAPNYEPNSFDNIVERPETREHPYEVSGIVARSEYTHINDDFVQAGDLYRLLSEEEKARLVDNIVTHLGNAKREIQIRQTGHFYKADPDYGRRVAQGLGLESEFPQPDAVPAD